MKKLCEMFVALCVSQEEVQTNYLWTKSFSIVRKVASFRSAFKVPLQRKIF